MKKNNEVELRQIIDRILFILKNNFDKNNKDKISFEEILQLCIDLNNLLNNYSTINKTEAGKICINDFIPLLNFIIKYDTNKNHLLNYYNCLENSYLLSARISLEHFIIYYEWEDGKEKLYENRYEILKSYVYFLNRMCYKKTNIIIANLPSGWGKTRIAKLYEAFRLGIEPEGTFLSLCSNDDVVKSGSRSVIDIIKNERYGKVFPNNSYQIYGKNLFLKETDGLWKIKNCKLNSSYIASTTNSNVVGSRASLSINIDDLYANYREALDENLNKFYYNQFVTVWRKRYIQNMIPQILISGTLWSPTDFLTKIINLLKTQDDFFKHPTLKYTLINKDMSAVIIQVPAIDQDTNESSCPNLISTEQLIKEKNSMDTYLWQTNFQQNPIAPESLYFDYSNLMTYDTIPINASGYSYSVIDGTRRSSKDFFAMPIYIPNGADYLLIDCIFTKTSTNDLHQDIIDKIKQWHIVRLVIESNVDGGLKTILDEKLKAQGIYYCEIEEKYNTVPKPTRIEMEKSSIRRRIYFPRKGLFGINTEMGKFMENFTMYNLDGGNRNDDAPDSNAMFSSEIIENRSVTQKAVACYKI